MSEALVQPVWLPPRTTLGAPKHDEITGFGSVAGGFLVDRKFGDGNALRAKALPHRRAFVVVREHPDACGARRLRQPGNRRRHVMAAGDDALHQAVERLIGEPRALDHSAALQRLGEAGDGRVHVVVEGEQIDAAFRQPVDDFAFRVEIVGLVAQMEAGVGGEKRPHLLDRLQQFPRIVRTAQGRAPTTRSWRDRRW